jgi:hypothetical protein
MSLDSYNSQYPLAYYDVGTAYSFYTHNLNLDKLAEADKETAKKYASALVSAVADNKKFVGGDGKWAAFTRVVGVVVEKHESTGNGDVDAVVAMFKTTGGSYVINKFAVGVQDVFTNEKEAVAPAATFGANAEAVASKKSNTISGATVATTSGATIDSIAGTTSGATVDTKSGATVAE